MMCSTCGKTVSEGSGFCSGCGSSVALAAAAGGGTTFAAPPQQAGGISLTGPSAASGQPSIVIQNVQSSQSPQFVPHQIKNPGIAMLLSIVFPGGGQFYNGHAGKGILILCTFWMIIPWIWGIFDAHSCANRINRVGF